MTHFQNRFSNTPGFGRHKGGGRADRLKLFIFDCDGTLIDSQHVIVAAMANAFAAQDLAAPDRAHVMSVIGLSLHDAIATLAPDVDRDTLEQLVKLYRGAFAENRSKALSHEQLYPGISDVISRLSAEPDVVLAIATGKSIAGVNRLLEQQDWTAHFSSIQTADTHPSKPHPSMIAQALEDTGVARSNAVMIGDTTYDMEMARAAGVGALGVDWGYHDTDDLSRAGAHVICRNVSSLIADLDRVVQAAESTA